jgi:valyl-tRNA synthetase
MAKPAIEAVKTGKTEFVPKNWEKTYFDWMENIQPWCISRQLWWGHQIPAWYDDNGGIYVAETEEDAQAQAGAGVKLTRDEDVLDTWFSSALWPFSTLGWPEKTPELDRYYPGDVLVTGFDIIFFWVARMMMMGIHFMGDVPFKKVYIHALVRDAKGQKMSKSKGNVIDPLDLIEKFGADALRFTLTAMAAQGRDIKLSEDRVEGYRNFATKLWNATRFCEMNDCLPKDGFDPATVTHPVNQWIVAKVKECQSNIDNALGDYKFNLAADAIYSFAWNTFCDWYVEFTKPLLNGTDESIKDEVKGTTGWVLDQILILLNPFMPYFSEELYAKIAQRGKGTRLLTAQWPDYKALPEHKDAFAQINWLQRIISEIRSVRADMNVPAGAKLTLLVKDASAKTQKDLSLYQPIIAQMARIENVELITAEPPKGSVQAVVDEATIALPIADIIDLDKERDRLAKQIAKLEQNIDKLSAKLSDEKFVANAPEEVIAEQKTRVAEDQAARDKLSAALKQLEAA